ncbi:jouberin [Ambystoma mexicanum]|uniref:jouberin n=1 Tax=Ambystoma mexicanum TaxID=8296 RepID=UPI0037E8CE84
MPTEESETKAKTKARFEEVFRSYAELTSSGKKHKKKSRPLPENIELESLQHDHYSIKETEHNVDVKKGVKDSEEKSNRHTKKKLKEKSPLSDLIHVPEAEKQTKTTKKKKKGALGDEINSEERMLQTVSHDVDGEGEEVTSKNKMQQDMLAPKGLQKKLRSALKDKQYVNDLEEDEQQLLKAYQLQVSEEEANEIKAKMKKKLMQQEETCTEPKDNQEIQFNSVGKKKKKVSHLIETSAMSISELQGFAPQESNIKKKLALEEDDEGIANMEKLREVADGRQKKTKVKKSKKKRKSENNTEIPDEHSQANNMYYKRLIDESLVLGIYIHQTDKLKSDLMLSHPMIKIHVIDEKTGLYVKKETSSYAVSSFSEQESVEHIRPIMTRPYDFRQFKSTLPQWEEQIIFIDPFGYLLQETEESPKVILFFELLDVLSVEDAGANFEIQCQERGFRKIAWAFLKLVGANGVLNVDGKLRLQLYYPPPRSRAQPSTVEVFEWWLRCARNRYPSTLYVTVKGLKLPDEFDPSSGSPRAGQQEHSTPFGDPQSPDGRKAKESSSEDKMKELVKWTRFPGQACRIPNKHLFSLQAGQQGCFSIRFSNDGRTLAAACADRDEYPVFLYEIPTGRYLQELHGHLNIVYDICWSRDDENLLTASSDGTARMWKMEAKVTSALKVFPHPSFVYTAKYHPVADYLVVTGCYDSVVRVWNVMAKEIHGQLLQELDGHKSFINTLCFDDEGIHMFSGDSSGLVIVWNTHVNGPLQQNQALNWCIKKEIRENDLKGVSVNHLQLHPNGRRLLIHAKDSTLRVMDLRILATKKYIGATNYREKIHSAFTPCGTFLFSGSEDGMAYVWNTETGDQVAKYSDLCYTSTLRDVDFHPHEHMVAFCAFGQSQPILVYIYDHKVSQLEAEMIKDLNGSFTSTAPKRQPIVSGSDMNKLQEASISEADHFVSTVRTSMRLQKVKQKLDSVMSGPSLPHAAPALLSPHSKLRFQGPLGTPLIPHQSLASQSGTFSPVGHPIGRSPSFVLQMRANESSTASLKTDADRLRPMQEMVVALYDYTAHRSDELTMHRSDIIQVLYKDNDSWWFGCLANGQQGYFPANYVAGETCCEEVLDYAPLLPTAQTEAGEGSSTPQRMSPAINKPRDQTCIPQPDIETGSPVAQGTQKKKKKALKMDPPGSTVRALPIGPQEPIANATHIENWPDITKGVDLKKKKKKGATAGTTNNAFEPDGYSFYQASH